MTINAIIPARAGSQRIHKKNIALLAGYPLIAYTIKACQMSQHINEIYVSTDSKEIANIAISYGATVPFIRSAELANNTAQDKDYLNHFFDHFDLSEVALMRPTTPLRHPEEIDRCIEQYFTQYRDICTSMISVHQYPESPYKALKINSFGLCSSLFDKDENFNMPNQSFTTSYMNNGYIDIIKQQQSRQNTGGVHGNKIAPFLCSQDAIEIDEPFQMKLLELYIQDQQPLIWKSLKAQRSQVDLNIHNFY